MTKRFELTFNFSFQQVAFAILTIASIVTAFELYDEVDVDEQLEPIVRPKRQFIAGLATGAVIEHHRHNHHGGHYNSYPGFLFSNFYSQSMQLLNDISILYQVITTHLRILVTLATADLDTTSKSSNFMITI